MTKTTRATYIAIEIAIEFIIAILNNALFKLIFSLPLNFAIAIENVFPTFAQTQRQ